MKVWGAILLLVLALPMAADDHDKSGSNSGGGSSNGGSSSGNRGPSDQTNQKRTEAQKKKKKLDDFAKNSGLPTETGEALSAALDPEAPNNKEAMEQMTELSPKQLDDMEAELTKEGSKDDPDLEPARELVKNLRDTRKSTDDQLKEIAEKDTKGDKKEEQKQALAKAEQTKRVKQAAEIQKKASQAAVKQYQDNLAAQHGKPAVSEEVVKQEVDRRMDTYKKDVLSPWADKKGLTQQSYQKSGYANKEEWMQAWANHHRPNTEKDVRQKMAQKAAQSPSTSEAGLDEVKDPGKTLENWKNLSPEAQAAARGALEKMSPEQLRNLANSMPEGSQGKELAETMASLKEAKPGAHAAGEIVAKTTPGSPANDEARAHLNQELSKQPVEKYGIVASDSDALKVLSEVASALRSAPGALDKVLQEGKPPEMAAVVDMAMQNPTVQQVLAERGVTAEGMKGLIEEANVRVGSIQGAPAGTKMSAAVYASEKAVSEGAKEIIRAAFESNPELQKSILDNAGNEAVKKVQDRINFAKKELASGKNGFVTNRVDQATIDILEGYKLSNGERRPGELDTARENARRAVSDVMLGKTRDQARDEIQKKYQTLYDTPGREWTKADATAMDEELKKYDYIDSKVYGSAYKEATKQLNEMAAKASKNQFSMQVGDASIRMTPAKPPPNMTTFPTESYGGRYEKVNGVETMIPSLYRRFGTQNLVSDKLPKGVGSEILRTRSKDATKKSKPKAAGIPIR